jgi:F-type H+-transporting ATPase subunit delta
MSTDAQSAQADDYPQTSDVSTQRIAKVYAEALLRAAENRNQAEQVFEELDSLAKDVVPNSPLIRNFFTSGVISRDKRAAALRSMFEKRSSELFSNLLLVLNDHERLNILPAVIVAYKELQDERAGRVRVVVRSAVPLSADQTDRIRREVRETFHKEPRMETRVEPDLLGGLVVQVGDWVFDGSVRSRLDDIKNQILTKGSHEIQSGRDRFCIATAD